MFFFFRSLLPFWNYSRCLLDEGYLFLFFVACVNWRQHFPWLYVKNIVVTNVAGSARGCWENKLSPEEERENKERHLFPPRWNCIAGIGYVQVNTSAIINGKCVKIRAMIFHFSNEPLVLAISKIPFCQRVGCYLQWVMTCVCLWWYFVFQVLKQELICCC